MSELVKRVLLVEFIESPDVPSRAAALLRKDKLALCGWVTRPKHASNIHRAAPDVDFFALGESIGHETLISVSDVFFSPEEEESILYLLDRERSYDNHLHSSQRRLEVLAWARYVLDTSTPDVIFFSDTPHNVYSYVLYLLARRYGLPTQFFQLGPLPNLFSFGSDITVGVVPTFEDGQCRKSHELSSQSTRYLAKLRLNYDTARPSSVLEQLRGSSYAGRLRALLSRPRDLFNGVAWRNVRAYVKRDLLKKYYESVAVADPDLDVPFVAVFLHLQPERSTVPEGGRYAQQYRLVQTLAAHAPKGWRIYVREHPATFRSGPKLVRGRWLYDGLLRLPSVTLISTRVDPFELVDHSRCVATVTGTVGIEAVARGVPCLAFGAAAYVGCSGVYRICDDHDLTAALNTISTGERVPADAAERFLAAFEASPRTYIADSDVGNDPRASATADARISVLRLMLREFVDGLKPSRGY